MPLTSTRIAESGWNVKGQNGIAIFMRSRPNNLRLTQFSEWVEAAGFSLREAQGVAGRVKLLGAVLEHGDQPPQVFEGETVTGAGSSEAALPEPVAERLRGTGEQPGSLAQADGARGLV
jgi:hypothetical protein